MGCGMTDALRPLPIIRRCLYPDCPAIAGFIRLAMPHLVPPLPAGQWCRAHAPAEFFRHLATGGGSPHPPGDSMAPLPPSPAVGGEGEDRRVAPATLAPSAVRPQGSLL